MQLDRQHVDALAERLGRDGDRPAGAFAEGPLVAVAGGLPLPVERAKVLGLLRADRVPPEVGLQRVVVRGRVVGDLAVRHRPAGDLHAVEIGHEPAAAGHIQRQPGDLRRIVHPEAPALADQAHLLHERVRAAEVDVRAVDRRAGGDAAVAVAELPAPGDLPRRIVERHARPARRRRGRVEAGVVEPLQVLRPAGGVGRGADFLGRAHRDLRRDERVVLPPEALLAENHLPRRFRRPSR